MIAKGCGVSVDNEDPASGSVAAPAAVVDHGNIDGITPSFSFKHLLAVAVGLAEKDLVSESLKSSGLKCALQTLEFSVGFHRILSGPGADEPVSDS